MIGRGITRNLEMQEKFIKSSDKKEERANVWDAVWGLI